MTKEQEAILTHFQPPEGVYDPVAWNAQLTEALVTGGCDWLTQFNEIVNPWPAAIIGRLCEAVEELSNPLTGVALAAHIEKGLAELSLEGHDHPGLAILCHSLKKTLGDAKNFVVLDVKPSGGEWMSVTIQRKETGTQSPAEKLVELKARIADLEAHIVRAGI